MACASPFRHLSRNSTHAGDFVAAWSNPDNAAQLRRALADSYDDGLNPADYHLPLLEELSGASRPIDGYGCCCAPNTTCC